MRGTPVASRKVYVAAHCLAEVHSDLGKTPADISCSVGRNRGHDGRDGLAKRPGAGPRRTSQARLQPGSAACNSLAWELSPFGDTESNTGIDRTKSPITHTILRPNVRKFSQEKSAAAHDSRRWRRFGSFRPKPDSAMRCRPGRQNSPRAAAAGRQRPGKASPGEP